MSEVKLYIPQPPKDIFTKRDVAPILNEKNVIYLIEDIKGIEYQGMLTKYVNVPYVKKGFPTPQAVHELNKIKKAILGVIKNINIPVLIGVYFLDKNKLFSSFNEFFDRTFITYDVRHHRIEPSFLCPAAFNFGNFIYSIILEYKVNEDVAKEFAFNIAQILEYDDAYRYRFQDAITELDVELFKKNPRKETKRIMGIMEKRSKNHVFESKIKPVINLSILVIPFIKKTLTKNIHLLKKSERDISDWYWVCLRDDAYDYGGMNLEERHAQFTERPETFEATA